MREIAATLGHIYPAMFRESKLPEKTMSGFEPSVNVLSLNQLAQKIIDRVRLNLFGKLNFIIIFLFLQFRGRIKRSRKLEAPEMPCDDDEEGEKSPVKKGRKLIHYGNFRFEILTFNGN